MIHAAIDGIKSNLRAAEAATENLFDKETAKKVAYKTIPDTLEEAREIAEKSDFVKSILG